MLLGTLKILVEIMTTSFKPEDCDTTTQFVDSMPIVTCESKKQRGLGHNEDNIQRELQRTCITME